MENEEKKIYLVDSENVGDLWVTHIMAMAKETDEIVVFYTQKSPHMGYDTIRKLLASEREVTFIKCAEGKNALDFQLVTELGYRIGKQKETHMYIMVTNDTGFDAVVQYWQNAKVNVKRYNAKFCQNQYNKMMVEAKLKEEKYVEPNHEKDEAVEAALPVLEPLSEEETVTKEESKEKTEKENKKEKKAEQKKETAKPNRKKTEEKVALEPKEETGEVQIDNELLRELVTCLGVQNSGEIHNALNVFLGNDGKQMYQKVKGNLKDFAKEEEMQTEERFQRYCHLLFERSDAKEMYPPNFSSFVYHAKDKRQNLNSFRSALLKEYGKEKGMQYYAMIKPHVKILNKM